MSELKAFDVIINEDYKTKCYMKADADKVIEAKDKEIAELKEQYKDMDVTHTVHIAKMNAKIEEQESEIAELKVKLENVQASMYADVVDANMENLRLKEERRWRKFPDEKPSEDIKFLVINEKGFMQCCYYSPILHEFQIPVTYWLPLPSAPKEA